MKTDLKLNLVLNSLDELASFTFTLDEETKKYEANLKTIIQNSKTFVCKKEELLKSVQTDSAPVLVAMRDTIGPISFGSYEEDLRRFLELAKEHFVQLYFELDNLVFRISKAKLEFEKLGFDIDVQTKDIGGIK